MVSEVHNVDCVEYMRTLPDNHFDIAICDPPYGDADNENFVMGGDLEVGSTVTSNRLRFHGGDRWNRYYKPQITPPNQQKADWDPHARWNVGNKVPKAVNHAYGGRFARYSGGEYSQRAMLQ